MGMSSGGEGLHDVGFTLQSSAGNQPDCVQRLADKQLVTAEIGRQAAGDWCRNCQAVAWSASCFKATQPWGMTCAPCHSLTVPTSLSSRFPDDLCSYQQLACWVLYTVWLLACQTLQGKPSILKIFYTTWYAYPTSYAVSAWLLCLLLSSNSLHLDGCAFFMSTSHCALVCRTCMWESAPSLLLFGNCLL